MCWPFATHMLPVHPIRGSRTYVLMVPLAGLLTLMAFCSKLLKHIDALANGNLPNDDRRQKGMKAKKERGGWETSISLSCQKTCSIAQLDGNVITDCT